MVDGNKNNMLSPPSRLITYTILMVFQQHCGLVEMKILLSCMLKFCCCNLTQKKQNKKKIKKTKTPGEAPLHLLFVEAT